MILSDRDIKEAIVSGDLIIEPMEFNALQPASVDLRIGNLFRVFHPGRYPYIDVREEMPKLTELVEVEEGEEFVLHPGEFVIGSTVEHVEIPVWAVGRLDGKSSLGRLGLLVHATAGFFDPGFKGHATLELYNVSPLAINLVPGMYVAQMSFMRLTSPSDRPYGSSTTSSKYQNQVGPTASRYFENFKKGS